MSRRRARKWPWFALLLAVGGAGVRWWMNEKNGEPTGPTYETTQVSKGDIKKIVKASGVANPLAKVEIGSQISGTIVKLNVDFNSMVKAGDILCHLDPATYDAAYAQAEAERISAEADRDFQRKTLERRRTLLEQNLSSIADFDKAESELKVGEAKLLLAEARVKKAKVDLERCTIYAPIDGIIIDRTAELGQTIAASFNAPKLFVLANDLTKMQINAKVCEADIGQVAPKQKVKFKVDAYAESFEGEVVQVRNSPISEENVVNYDAIISVNNPDLKLKPGMTGDTDIITSERFDVVRVPNGALRFKPSKPRSDSKDAKPSAMPAQDDPAQRQLYLPPTNPGDEPAMVKVKIGITDGINTEIIEGITEGTKVVLLMVPTGSAGSQTNPFSGGMGGRR